MRTGAGIEFMNTLDDFIPHVNKEGKKVKKSINREEHTSPVTALGKYLFLNAVKGTLFDGGKNSIFDKAMKAYFQGSLPKFMDDRLKYKDQDGKMVYDYSSLPPLEHLTDILNGDISIWARYFHPNVNNNFTTDLDSMSDKDMANGEHLIGGINPNVIVLSDEQTIAQKFKVDVNVKITPQIAAAQQDLIYRIAIGEKITSTQIKNTLNGVINAPIKAQIKQTKVLNNAVTKARASKFSKSSKGMSDWDLDDTLARTKSGVRANIPNIDGTPKPGRKVIFLAGGAGSGKSNVVKQLGLEDQGFKVVNSDISLEWLKKNHGLPTDMKDLTSEQLSQLGKLQHQARQIALGKKMKYQGKGDGIVVDGTGGSLNVMKKQVQEFKDKGYDVQMMFVETSLETALERNAARKERTLKESIVRKNHEAVQGNKDGFKKLFGENFAEVKTDNLKQTDPMPSQLVNKLDKFTKSYENRRLTAEEFATEGSDILEQGGKFDFAEFDQIVEGEKGPLFGKAMESAKKFGL